MDVPSTEAPYRREEARAAAGWAWSAGALAIAALIAAPILSVLWLAFHPTENIWPHLLSTTLPRYLGNTLALAALTGAFAAAVGTGAAWLIAMYRFPGSRALEWLLLLPLSVPAFVGAWALVDFLEYAGPVQSGLRATFGWATARDYWFPDVKTRLGAAVVLASALYPYVYLLARAAFREQPGGAYEVARALGTAGPRLFWRVGLPLARPAIAAGTAIVMMETVADYGVVSYFSVQTLTTGIFTTWLELRNAGGAAQIACLILGLVLALVAVERASRNRLRHYQSARQPRPVARMALTGWRGAAAGLACAAPIAAGFALPVGVMGWHAAHAPGAFVAPGLVRALTHTLTTACTAAAITVALALMMVYGARMAGRGLPRHLLPVTALGYAAPGAVLAVGLLIPLAALDHWLADGLLAATGHDPGLLLTGSAAAIVLAYVVRFFAIAQGSTDAAFGRVSPSLPMAARSLGRTAGGTLRAVYLPLMRGTVGSALLLVFVDCVKELPATLLLRPFNYETLATRAQEQASLERLSEASPAALLIIAVGLVAVAFLARATREKARR
ncbi:iron ABC transporter permease [Frigidibacter sp. MR17.14]|uniref:ABC transporter permease n=1 Tax=Frigidibacter sp. MR17.14 TaxID=3126509 RepID=UPI003012DD47